MDLAPLFFGEDARNDERISLVSSLVTIAAGLALDRRRQRRIAFRSPLQRMTYVVYGALGLLADDLLSGVPSLRGLASLRSPSRPVVSPRSR
jgi:hypothetical protein